MNCSLDERKLAGLQGCPFSSIHKPTSGGTWLHVGGPPCIRRTGCVGSTPYESKVRGGGGSGGIVTASS